MEWEKTENVLLEAGEVDVSLCDGDAPENDVDHGADEDGPVAIRGDKGETMKYIKAGEAHTRPGQSWPCLTWGET